MNILNGLLKVLTVILLGASPLLVAPVFANQAKGAETKHEEASKADPNHPTTLDKRDPSFETLKQTQHKPNANYDIREFKEGSKQSLEGMLSSLKKRSEENLNKISKLNKKLQSMQNEEKEKISLGLEDMRKKQETYLETLNKYSSGPYQTNLSTQTLRAELQQIETEVMNVTSLLGAWQKDNITAWE